MSASVHRRFYMCLNVAGFLRNTKFPGGYVGVFQEDDGTSMSPEAAHDVLINELTKGHRVIPMSPECSNPCKHKGCAGFDFGEQGGCPGYNLEAHK